MPTIKPHLARGWEFSSLYENRSQDEDLGWQPSGRNPRRKMTDFDDEAPQSSAGPSNKWRRKTGGEKGGKDDWNLKGRSNRELTLQEQSEAVNRDSDSSLSPRSTRNPANYR